MEREKLFVNSTYSKNLKKKRNAPRFISAVSILIPVIIIIIISGCSVSSSVLNDEKLLQGEWSIKNAKLAGNVLPPSFFGKGNLKLIEGRYEFQNDSGDYTVNVNNLPKEMNVIGKEGPNKGKNIPAIFELKSDTLNICYDLDCKSRPTLFESKAGSKLFLVKYQRVK